MGSKVMARPVSPPRSPWAHANGVGDDAKVILELRASEPTVLRTARAEWYFEAERRPVALPKPRWRYDRASLLWSEGKSWIEAWEDCAMGSWMLHAAVESGVPAEKCVVAACWCAKVAGVGHDDPAISALSSAMSWATGSDGDRAAAVSSARSAGRAAAERAERLRSDGDRSGAPPPPAYAAAMAASCCAMAVAGAAARDAKAIMASRLGDAAKYADEASSLASLAGGRRATLAHEMVRQHVRAEDVLHALTYGRSR